MASEGNRSKLWKTMHFLTVARRAEFPTVCISARSKNVAKQALLRFLPSAPRRHLHPRPPSTVKGITGGVPGNGENRMENHVSPRPQESSPGFAQSRNSYRPHFPMINQKTRKTFKNKHFCDSYRPHPAATSACGHRRLPMKSPGAHQETLENYWGNNGFCILTGKPCFAFG